MAARQKSFRGDHASDEVFDFECGPCQFDGKILEANGFCSDCSEYLCDLCFRTHLKPMPCRHHILLDASKMPKDKSAVKTVDVITVRCEKHAANVIEYYCSIHEYLGCSTCMTLEHRACECVGFIPSIAEGLYESLEYVGYKQSIIAVVKSTEDNELKINVNTTEAERLYNTTKQEIKEYRKKINSFIDSLEKKIDTHLSNLHDHRITLLKEATDSNKSLEKEIKDVSAEITKGEKQVKRIDSFILMKQTKGNIQEYTKMADEILYKSNVSKYSFRNEFEKCKPFLDGLFGSIVEEGQIKPKHVYGASTSTGTSSLFGTIQTPQAAATGGLFGQSKPLVGATATTQQSGGFGFGTNTSTATTQQSGGFGFGTNTSTATTQQSGGLGFGTNTSTATTQHSGGLGFGTNTSTATTQHSGGFGFGTNTSTATTQQSGGFGFGTNTSTATTQHSGGFGFGTNTSTATTQQSGGFGFGTNTSTATTQHSGGFDFGTNTSTATTQQSGGFDFGTNTSTATTQHSGGFDFGTNTSTATTQQSGGFGFGTNTSTGTGGLFGQTAASKPLFGAATTQPSLFGTGAGTTFGQPAAAAASTGFGTGFDTSQAGSLFASKTPAFGTQTTASTDGFGFGAQPQTQSSLFSKPLSAQQTTGIGGFNTATSATGFGGKYDVPTHGSELAKAMYIGARVQRGKDWQIHYGIQDEHGPGTLTEWGKHPGWVRVTWDNGKKYQYRYGADNAYDVMFVPGTYDASKSNRK